MPDVILRDLCHYFIMTSGIILFLNVLICKLGMMTLAPWKKRKNLFLQIPISQVRPAVVKLCFQGLSASKWTSLRF